MFTNNFMSIKEIINELEQELRVARDREHQARLKQNFVGEAIHSSYADKLRWLIKLLTPNTDE